MKRVPQFGERVYWEPLAPDGVKTYGNISFVAPTPERDAYRITVNWDVSDGEGRHETQHHFTATSHVKFAEKDSADV